MLAKDGGSEQTCDPDDQEGKLFERKAIGPENNAAQQQCQGAMWYPAVQSVSVVDGLLESRKEGHICLVLCPACNAVYGTQ